MNEQKIDNFYGDWLKNLPHLNEGYIYLEGKTLRPARYIFSYFKKLISNFLNDNIDEFEKIVLLPGIRGVGKTTLLMQIFKIEKFLDDNDTQLVQNLKKLDYRFYFDVNKLHFEQITLNEFFKFFEKVNNFNFVGLNKKVLLLLDEVHFDPRWSLFLKVLFDSIKGHKNLLVIATGSSALNIRMSADLARRSTVTELYPMKFNEYLALKHGVHPVNGASDELQKIFFSSQGAKEVFKQLKKQADDVMRFFINLPPQADEDFFKNGGFPFTVGLCNQIEISERIKNIIDGVITKDVITLRTFKTGTVSKVNDLLYLLANSDLISFDKLQKSLRIENIRTLSALLDVLVMSGILLKIKSYGQTYGTTRKTPKYLFITPSLRSAILDNAFPSGIEGKKIEDYFALIFQRDIKRREIFGPLKLSYDVAEGGADFVLTLKDRSNIVIEVGFNKEETKQVENTMKKVKSRYGLVFGSSSLELVNNSIVKIPLKFLLLI
ncbi:MAG: AAA family ATPase [Elusimicrobiota bacterium]